MKKLFFLIVMSCLLMVSCGKKAETTTPEEGQPAQQGHCQMTEEQKAMFANYENWDNLTDDVKATTLNDMKAFFDAKKAECASKKEGCKGNCKEGEHKEGCCKEGAKKEGCCKEGAKKEGCCKEGAQKEGCKGNCKEGCKCKEGGECTCENCEHQAKKAECEKMKAEFDTKWNNWANLTIDEQKALIDQVIACHKHKKEGGCHKENPEGCPNK